MKIIINNCYGGFNLSLLAQQEYAKLKGFKLFFYRRTKSMHCDKINEFERIEADDSIFTISIKKDLGMITNKLPSKANLQFYDRDIERTDKDLIKVVEVLGEKANGEYAELKIIEIPDDINYEIEEYDGMEHIAESHQTWS